MSMDVDVWRESRNRPAWRDRCLTKKPEAGGERNRQRAHVDARNDILLPQEEERMFKNSLKIAVIVAVVMTSVAAQQPTVKRTVLKQEDLVNTPGYAVALV